MRLRLHTDFALRVLLFLAHVRRKSKADEIATAFSISRDHLVKVIQQLGAHGYVQTQAGRGGGITLAVDPKDVTIRDVVEKLEGRQGVLDCFSDPTICPMEPGCSLRGLLMEAEGAFFDTLAKRTLADLSGGTGGMRNLMLGED